MSQADTENLFVLLMTSLFPLSLYKCAIFKNILETYKKRMG